MCFKTMVYGLAICYSPQDLSARTSLIHAAGYFQIINSHSYNYSDNYRLLSPGIAAACIAMVTTYVARG